MKFWILFLIFLPVVAWGQDQELTPDGENNPTNVFADNCSTACNATACNTDVDEGLASSDNVHNRSTTNDATILYDFPTPSANPSTAAGAQSVDIENSRCDDDASCSVRTDQNNPDFTVEIYCNGSPLTTPQVVYSQVLVTGSDQQNTGGTFTFNTTDCAADGSDLQMLYTFGRSGGGPAARNWPCVDTIEWNVTHEAAGARRRTLVIQ